VIRGFTDYLEMMNYPDLCSFVFGKGLIANGNIHLNLFYGLVYITKTRLVIPQRGTASLKTRSRILSRRPRSLTTSTLILRKDSIVVDLGQFLKQDKEQLRQNPERFSHAKCYIFDELAVVGSGNFTRPGLPESPSRPNGSEKAFILVSA
jgi:hypothetical protein